MGFGIAGKRGARATSHPMKFRIDANSQISSGQPIPAAAPSSGLGFLWDFDPDLSLNPPGFGWERLKPQIYLLIISDWGGKGSNLNLPLNSLRFGVEKTETPMFP